MRGILILSLLLIAVPGLAYEGIVEPKTATFERLELLNGGTIAPLTVVYQTYGTLDSDGRNAILVLHGMGGTGTPPGGIRRTGRAVTGMSLSGQENPSIPTSTS